jgi:hypothetical protein
MSHIMACYISVVDSEGDFARRDHVSSYNFRWALKCPLTCSQTSGRVRCRLISSNLFPMPHSLGLRAAPVDTVLATRLDVIRVINP